MGLRCLSPEGAFYVFPSADGMQLFVVIVVVAVVVLALDAAVAGVASVAGVVSVAGVAIDDDNTR